MLQRQDMVPPWIEKQQELARAARVFRERLRNDWRRHAARTIAASGGSLQEQMRRANDHAAAERRGPGAGPAARFRDGAWERAEAAYMALSVERLNSLTRSYNLVAPAVARKPYLLAGAQAGGLLCRRGAAGGGRD